MNLGQILTLKIFKPIVDNLNRYRDSYDDLIESQNEMSNDLGIRALQDLEFQLAVALITAKQENNPAIKLGLESTVLGYSQELKLNTERINNIAQKLRPSQIDYEIKEGHAPFSWIILKVTAVAGAIELVTSGLGGYLAHSLMGFFF